MRNILIKKITQLAETDPNLYLIVGDLGFSVVEDFVAKFPNRFINAGIAEQNMIGMAAGLAMSGKNVYCYSIVPFITMRCFEQVRVDLCYQNLPVKLIGVGGGLNYGPFGVTHHAIEDIAIMRALPGMTVLAPANKFEMEQLVPQLNVLSGPVYIRVTGTDETFAHPNKARIVLGKAAEIISGDEVLLLATSNMVDHAHKICEQLCSHGINAGLACIHTIKPFDHEYLISKQKKLKAVFTIEEHSIIGGLGEATARIICENFQQKVIFKAFGIQDFYPHEIGSRKYLQEKAGLSVESIHAIIMQKLIGTGVVKPTIIRQYISRMVSGS